MPTIIEDILKRFQHQGIVTRKEIMAKLGDQVKTTTAVKGLLENRKALFIKKGLYYLKSPDEWYRDYVEINPLLLAGRMHPKSVVGYHAALKCYGTAYSESNLFQVALDNSVRRVSKPFEFQNVRYQFYKADLSFGIVSSVLDKFKIKHFSRERILLEGLMFSKRFSGISDRDGVLTLVSGTLVLVTKTAVFEKLRVFIPVEFVIQTSIILITEYPLITYQFLSV